MSSSGHRTATIPSNARRRVSKNRKAGHNAPIAATFMLPSCRRVSKGPRNSGTGDACGRVQPWLGIMFVRGQQQPTLFPACGSSGVCAPEPAARSHSR